MIKSLIDISEDPTCYVLQLIICALLMQKSAFHFNIVRV